MSAVTQAFERLGRIREQIADLEVVAADVDDDFLSQHIARMGVANTTGMVRATQLLRIEKATGLRDDDLAVRTPRSPEEGSA